MRFRRRRNRYEVIDLLLVFLIRLFLVSEIYLAFAFVCYALGRILQ